MTSVSPWRFFYALVAIVLAVAGLALVIFPQGVQQLMHPELIISDSNALLTRQVGWGLLLAAAINAICLGDYDARRLLHGAAFVFLVGLLASHGLGTVLALWWLWLPVVAYGATLIPLPALKRALPQLNDGEQRGEVKWFNPNKGFGFILTDDGDELFVHFKALQNGGRRSLRTGTRVRYVIRESERGDQADQVYIEE